MTVFRRRLAACLRCTQIRQACHGHFPCARCTRLNIPCRPRNRASNAGGGVAFETLVSDARALVRRVRTGCLTCKQRKKKCNESKPKCSDCQRLYLNCDWPPGHINKGLESQETLLMEKDTQQKAAKVQPSPPTKAAVMKSTSRHKSNTETHTKISVVVPQISNESGFGHTTNIPRVNNNSKASKQYAARETREASVITTPVCGETISSPSSIQSFTPDTPLSPNMPDFPLQLASPLDRGLLNHFLTNVSPLLSRRSSPSANPYNIYLMPMAHQNETVLHCILALSGTHWRNMQPEMGNRGLFHQSQAATALANILSHIDETSMDIALTCSLLLCMTELFDGTSESWQFHLGGAAALLTASQQQNHNAWTGQRKFLLQLARFLDSAAAISTCRPPIIQDGAAGIDGATTAIPDGTELAVYGIPKELFHLGDHVSDLAHKCKKCADAPSKALLRQEAAHVEDRIHHWPCAYGGSQTVSALRFTDENILHAATAFEHALRLRLHQVVEGYALDSPKVAQTIDAIICSVQSIRYGGPLEPCLLFPLAMAGSSCCKPEHRIIVQDRLKVMERTCGFGNVFRTRVLVEEVWSRRGSEGRTAAVVDWTRIRDDKMRGLVVF